MLMCEKNDGQWTEKNGTLKWVPKKDPTMQSKRNRYQTIRRRTWCCKIKVLPHTEGVYEFHVIIFKSKATAVNVIAVGKFIVVLIFPTS